MWSRSSLNKHSREDGETSYPEVQDDLNQCVRFSKLGDFSANKVNERVKTGDSFKLTLNSDFYVMTQATEFDKLTSQRLLFYLRPMSLIRRTRSRLQQNFVWLSVFQISQPFVS